MDLKPGQVRPDISAGFVQLDGHTGVMRRFTLASADEEGGAELEMEVEVDASGKPHCQRITISGDDVTSETLRGVPIGRLMRNAMMAPFLFFKVGEPPSDGGVRMDFPSVTERADYYESYVKGARLPRRGTPFTDENLRGVADVYRAALERGDSPTQTVAEQMHVARSTAARWVAKARERGFLGQAVRGKAGEQ